MYTITGQHHDQGAHAVTVFRHHAAHAADCARLLEESGYLAVRVLDLGAMSTPDDVRAFLGDIHRYEPVDWRVLEHAFEIVHGRPPTQRERHPWLCLEQIRRAVVSTTVGCA